MTISGSSFNTAYATMQQSQKNQAPSASEITSDIMEVSDLDADSLLSIDEVSLSDETFSNMDEDGDGSLSSEEIETSFSALLENMKNQTTTPEEFGTLLTNMGLEVPKAPQNMANTSNTPNIADLASEIFAQNDVNQDGTLSVDELDISDELLSIIDSDDDGSITEEELESGLKTLFDSVESGEKTKEEVGQELTSLGVPPPPPSSETGGGQSGGGGGSEESSSSEETYDAADLNEDGTVTSAEQAEYDALNGTISSDEMADYTMNLVGTLMDAMKNESESPDDIELSQFKSVMTMVNNEIQDNSTAEKLNAYVSNLDLGLKSA